jgi:hypothetical protein
MRRRCLPLNVSYIFAVVEPVKGLCFLFWTFADRNKKRIGLPDIVRREAFAMAKACETADY